MHNNQKTLVKTVVIILTACAAGGLNVRYIGQSCQFEIQLKQATTVADKAK